MGATSGKLFLFITALVEGTVGICLLFLPAVLFALLLGLEQAAAETIFVGRIAGAALLAIGVASWLARNDSFTAAQLGLWSGIFIYNATVSTLLVYAGTVFKMNGILLWPTVAIHAILAVWCLDCLRQDGITKLRSRDF